MFKRNMLVFMLLLTTASPSWAKGMKGNLEDNELAYLDNL